MQSVEWDEIDSRILVREKFLAKYIKQFYIRFFISLRLSNFQIKLLIEMKQCSQQGWPNHIEISSQTHILYLLFYFMCSSYIMRHKIFMEICTLRIENSLLVNINFAENDVYIYFL